MAAFAELAEPFCDVPFVAPSDRAAAIALILSIIGRSAIPGCVPMFNIGATAPGSGKGLTGDTAITIATGRSAPKMPGVPEVLADYPAPNRHLTLTPTLWPAMRTLLLCLGIAAWAGCAAGEDDVELSSNEQAASGTGCSSVTLTVPSKGTELPSNTSMPMTAQANCSTSSTVAEFQFYVRKKQSPIKIPVGTTFGLPGFLVFASWNGTNDIGNWIAGVRSRAVGNPIAPWNVAEVAFTVLNQVPVAVADSATVRELSAVLINVLANDTDPEGDALSIKSANGATKGKTSIDAAGVITYRPNLGATGTDSFTYALVDARGGHATGTVSVTILPVPCFGILRPHPSPTAIGKALVLRVENADCLVHSTGFRFEWHRRSGTQAFPKKPFATTQASFEPGGASSSVTVQTTNEQPATHEFYVVIRATGASSGFQTNTVAVSLQQPSCSSVVLNTPATNTAATVGTPVPLSATATCIYGTVPEYRFRIRDDSYAEASVPPYTLSSTGTWMPAYADVWLINAQVKVSGAANTTGIASPTSYVAVADPNHPPTAVDDLVGTLEDTSVDVLPLANDSDIDGNPLTILSVANPPHGVAVIIGNTIRYTPNTNYVGPDAFSYVIKDGLATASAVIHVDVAPINDPPIAGNDHFDVDEDTEGAIDVLANDSDVDGDTLVASLATPAAHGTAALVGGVLHYTPAPNYFGADAVSYTLSDGTSSVTGSVTISVKPVNDAPKANMASATTPQATAVDIALSGTDVDGDVLAFVVVDAPAHGAVVITGSVARYTPETTFSGGDTFTIRASDGSATSEPTSVAVTVAPAVCGDGVINAAAGEECEDGNTVNRDGCEDTCRLSCGTGTGASRARVHAATDNCFAAYDNSFATYEESRARCASNGGRLATFASLEENLVAASALPPPFPQAFIGFDNLDGSYDWVSGEAPLFTNWVPGEPNGGAQQCAVLYEQGRWLDANCTNQPGYSWHVLCEFPAPGGEHLPPIAAADSLEVDEDTPGDIDLFANDINPDASALTLVGITAPPAHGTVTVEGGIAHFTPAANYHGADAFTYEVTNGYGSSQATVTVTVEAVNDAPVAVDAIGATLQRVAVDLALSATDVDGDPLTYAIASDPTHGTASISGTTLHYDPVSTFSGTETFSFRASDGAASSGDRTVTIVVTPVVCGDGIVHAPAGEECEDGNTLDGDGCEAGCVLSCGSGTGANRATIDPATGNCFAAYDGNVSSYAVADAFCRGLGGHLPTLVSPSENAAAYAALVGSDRNAWIGADDRITSGTFQWISAETFAFSNWRAGEPNQGGGEACAVFYDDGEWIDARCDNNPGYSHHVLCEFPAPGGENRRPVANADQFATDEDTTAVVDLTANDTDPDGDTLIGSITTAPAHGVVTVQGGVATYTPAPEFHGIDAFTYAITDGHETASALVTVEVRSINDRPVAHPTEATTSQATPVDISLLGSDIDGDPLTFTIAEGSGHGSVTMVSANVVRYSPDLAFSGQDEFTVRASDGALESDRAFVRVTVAEAPSCDDTVELALGVTWSCARLHDGTVRCWGSNSHGELGNGTTTGSLTPVEVASLSGVTRIVAGETHACALLADSTVRCWGDNVDGELGDGGTTDQSIPVAVTGLSGVTDLAAGHHHTCALLASGAVMCWGRNDHGQLGDGTTTSSGPVVVSSLTGATQIAAGYYHTCARIDDGRVQCWGQNAGGSLGDGTTEDRTLPTTVVDLSGAIQVDAGYLHTCALIANGTVRCWGSSGYGQVGDGTTGNGFLTPITVTGLSGVTEIELGYAHSCAVLTDGRARCWGYDEVGTLGDGSLGGSFGSPLVVFGLSTVVEIGAGDFHTCATLGDGTTRCWGYNTSGQIGDGTADTHSTASSPVVVACASAATCGDGVLGALESCDDGNLVAGDGCDATCAPEHSWSCTGVPSVCASSSSCDEVVDVRGGYRSTCAVMGDGSARCWGNNAGGHLGDGTGGNRSVPTIVVGLAGATEIAPGVYHSCALIEDGTVRCWGDNSLGQLGGGTVAPASLAPIAVPGLSEVVELRAGDYHTCALRTDRTLWCWGRNQIGQLGDGTLTTRATPAPVLGLSSVIEIALHRDQSCAVLADGTARCWGANPFGVLGDRTTVARSAPVPVQDLTGVVEIALGEQHACARLGDGTARCWGRGAQNQLGDGTGTSSLAPVVVTGITSATQVVAGDFHSCAVLTDGSARCWGVNSDGELGDGTFDARTTPVAVAGLTGLIQIGAGSFQSCALDGNGELQCWGVNSQGECGNGSNAPTPTPTPTAPFQCGTAILCGDGLVELGEDCDDGNVENDDGCDLGCRVEYRWTCAGSPSVCSSIPNSPPVAASDSFDTWEDDVTTFDVLANDSDVDGDWLFVANFSFPAHGTLMFYGNVAQYISAPNYHGPDSFTYTVSDGQGGTSEGSVVLNVHPINDEPIANGDTMIVDEDGSATIDVIANDVDVDDDVLFVEDFSQPAHGTVTLVLGLLHYVPSSDFYGSDSFVYTVSDGNGGRTVGTVNVAVAEINDPPTAADGAFSFDEDTELNFNVLSGAFDRDGDELTVTGFVPPQHGTLTVNALGAAHYEPARDGYGLDTFSYSISDGRGGIATGQVTLTINSVDDVPIAMNDVVSMAEDTVSAPLDVVFNDLGIGDALLVVAIVTQGTKGTATVVGSNQVIYTPHHDATGIDAFTYGVRDADNQISTATVAVTITPVDDNPIAADGAASTIQPDPITIALTATDVDGDPLTFSIVSPPSNGTLGAITGNTVTYIPAASATGQDSFTFTASDGSAPTSNTGTVSITIVPCGDLNTDLNNCGSCGHVCTVPAGGTATCETGTCTLTAPVASLQLWSTPASGSFMSIWADGKILTDGSEATLIDPATGIGAPTTGVGVRGSIWIDPAGDSRSVNGGAENRRGFKESGAPAWSWIQLGCCHFNGNMPVNSVTGHAYTAQNNTLYKVDLTTGSLVAATGGGVFFGRDAIDDTSAFTAGYEGTVSRYSISGPMAFSWSRSIATGELLSPQALLADGSIVVTASSTGRLARILVNGTIAFNIPVTGPTAPVVTADALILVGNNTPRLVAYTTAGAFAWSVTLPAQPVDLIVGAGGLIYVLTATSVVTYDRGANKITETYTGLVNPAEMLLRGGVLYILGAGTVKALPVEALDYDAGSPWPVRYHDNQRTANRMTPLSH